MFSAIIHRKGIHHVFNEDALTSLVFDSLKMLPSEILNKFIESALNLDGKAFEWFSGISKAENPNFDYWHCFSKKDFPEIAISCIPDLIIEWKDFMILEESKWGSGKSSKEEDQSTQLLDEPESMQEDEREKAQIDQLAREFLVAKKLAEDKKAFTILFVTDDLAIPREIMEASLEAFKRKNPNASEKEFRKLFYWTSWHNLLVVLLNYKNKIELANNLYQALEVLEINRPFTGFCFLNEFIISDSGLLNHQNIFFRSFTGHKDRDHQDARFCGFDFLSGTPGPDSRILDQSHIFYQGGKNE